MIFLNEVNQKSQTVTFGRAIAAVTKVSSGSAFCVRRRRRYSR